MMESNCFRYDLFTSTQIPDYCNFYNKETMGINWEQIKEQIIAETNCIICNDVNININEVVDLFINTVKYPLDNKDLDGIQTRLPNALQKILVDPLSLADKNAFFPEIGVIEPFLRKVLFLTKFNLYEKIRSEKKGLAAIISCLDLNPENIDYNSKNQFSNNSIFFSNHLVKAYNLRNLEGHNCTAWSNSGLYDSLRSVLVVYIYVTYIHKRELKVAIDPFDVTPYLTLEVKKIKELQSRFVHIEGKEEIAEINLYAKEFLEEDCDSDGKEENEEIQIAREGTIDNLRKSLKERKMVILGDIGMGKSTTLLYLHLQDAISALSNSSTPIPIYLELKNQSDKDTLIEKIKIKLNLDIVIVHELLNKGRLNIFLDGLNEIENKFKVSVFKQILNLITDYPANFFIIASRPNHYNREFDNQFANIKLPVFILQKMVDKQITEFLSKNGPKVKDYILREITNNDRLKKIIQTPLMLIMLIAVVIKEGSIPNEKAKIIKAFIFSLYDREQKQIIDFDKDLYHLLLCFLGHQTKALTGSNSGLDRDKYILPLLQHRKEELGVTVNLLDFLRKSIDLNILVNDNNQFSFSHEVFQEYYAAEYLHLLRKS